MMAWVSTNILKKVEYVYTTDCGFFIIRYTHTGKKIGKTSDHVTFIGDINTNFYNNNKGKLHCCFNRRYTYTERNKKLNQVYS